jgi:hypothetical protein
MAELSAREAAAWNVNKEQKRKVVPRFSNSNKSSERGSEEMLRGR